MSKIDELTTPTVETGHAPSLQNGTYQNQYRIATARYIHHDYNGGEYFITLCTKDRQHSLGNISLNTAQEFEMHLSTIGQYAEQVIKQVSQHHPYAEIPLYVIMPNHIHLILIIRNNNTPTVETGHAPSPQTNAKLHGSSELSAQPVETGHAPSLQNDAKLHNNPELSANTVETGHAPSLQMPNAKMQSISTRKGKLSVTIGSIKSAITKYANEHQIPFVWQTRFHDHIIRDQKEMNIIAEYIEFNIPNWGIDELNNETE